jgi:glyoxylase-like metal-dependent hydrolase (beta-lactamase superfamily II)
MAQLRQNQPAAAPPPVAGAPPAATARPAARSAPPRNTPPGNSPPVNAPAAAPDSGAPGQSAAPADLQTIHVQGNVYLIAGGGSNVAVQIGDDGVVVVDTGGGTKTDRLLAAIRALSTKEIRWVINTEFDADHTGGNQAVSLAGRTVNGNPAAVVAHENASLRMVQAQVADGARPFNTYFEDGRDFPFNGEAVFLYHEPAAHTDAGTMVLFRRSDVIVAGDVFLTTTYPVIDTRNGGSVRGTIRALNRILDLAVPSKLLQEGGTYIIPGHGRIADEADVVEYRDMLAIVTDRVADMIARGMTLAEVKAARPTGDFDGRYGRDSGPWTTAMFVDAVYGELARDKAPGGARGSR